MKPRLSPDQVAKMFGVTKSTVIAWCDSAIMPAVNVASESATRKRWRMSEKDIATFEQRRQNKSKAVAAASQSVRRMIQRPVKDYFATEQSSAN